MKKLSLLFFTASFAALQAQTHFGVKAGYSHSTIIMQDDQGRDFTFDPHSYFYVGGLAEHVLSDSFSLQGEVLYTQLGGSFSREMTAVVGTEVVVTGKENITFKTTQIQVPVAVNYFIAEKFSLAGGVNFGFDVSSRYTSDFNDGGTAPSGKTDLFKTVSIFPFLGAEFRFNENLFADARYHFGVMNSSISGAPQTKISFLQAGLGYRFL